MEPGEEPSSITISFLSVKLLAGTKLLGHQNCAKLMNCTNTLDLTAFQLRDTILNFRETFPSIQM